MVDLCPVNGNRRLCSKGDARLIIKQVNVEFALKEIALVTYQTIIQTDEILYKYMIHPCFTSL